jgi:flagellar biosynthesis/type III secretory pathway protein FliH
MSTYDLIVKEGVEIGIQQGLKQEIEKGIEQGIEKGIEQTLRKSTLEMLNSGLEEVMIIRFLQVDQAFIDQVKTEMQMD